MFGKLIIGRHNTIELVVQCLMTSNRADHLIKCTKCFVFVLFFWVVFLLFRRNFEIIYYQKHTYTVHTHKSDKKNANQMSIFRISKVFDECIAMRLFFIAFYFKYALKINRETPNESQSHKMISHFRIYCKMLYGSIQCQCLIEK